MGQACLHHLDILSIYIIVSYIIIEVLCKELIQRSEEKRLSLVENPMKYFISIVKTLNDDTSNNNSFRTGPFNPPV